ncbi:hypothetical protein JQ617_07000 [Bradyrhizobium sp. KB893862 SZCCT0404]|uniref:hypothetical protein n=1 Tax=Bradyrhizobium sp. KB893862 SZCCT0404 TaxID=2807672 RepID=UPI001BAB2B17|nr:hypothetical protein [Bradyrhizobium sp. KB893862 SZCCT0404]MBR1173698.1 hypothetical protein [Bradyrhizobium sp. KB893862 SZCCT0404]
MLTQRQKIAKLLDSPFEGERAAAQAALERTEAAPPPPGSPEWCAAMIEHKDMVTECAVRIDTPGLTADEVATIRRWARFVGKPWEDGAEELRRIHRQLMTEEQEQCLLPSMTKA